METIGEISVLVVFEDIKRILFDLSSVMMLPFLWFENVSFGALI